MGKKSTNRGVSCRLFRLIGVPALTLAVLLTLATPASAGYQWVWLYKVDGFVTSVIYDSAHENVYAGVQWGDVGIWRLTGSEASSSWSKISGVSIDTLAYDPIHNVLYALSAYGKITRYSAPDTNPVETPLGEPDNAMSLACDASHGVLYAGTSSGVWKFDGTTWTSTGGAVSSYIIHCLTYDSLRDVLYAGTYESGVWACSNPYSAPAWTESGRGKLMNNIGALAIDERHNVLYAGGPTLKRAVWACTNPNSSPKWTTMGGGVSPGRIESLYYDSGHNILYAGTDQDGVWESTNPDTSPSWIAKGCGVSENSMQIWSLAYDSSHDMLYLAGAGAGLWSSSVPSASPDFSSAINSDVPVVVERPAYFDYKGWTGGSDAVGAAAPSSTFYFAEGTCRPNFDPYITVENCGQLGTNVTLTYMKGDGTKVSQEITVAGLSRATVHPSDVLGVGDDVSHDFSTVVGSPDGQIVVERPMYFDYKGTWDGGSDVVGATLPSTAWYFAEGTTLTGFDEYITVLNPADATANLTFHYMVEGEGEKDVVGTVAPQSRATFRTADQIGMNKNASLVLSSDEKVVAERPMYFDYHGVWTGGHDVVGANAPTTNWHFAEGTTRHNSADGSFDEWLCLQNPGTSQISVNAIYLLAAGQGDPLARTYVIPAKQRLTVNVNKELGQNKDSSITLTSGSPFVAERPMYFSAWNKWTGGHDVIGAVSESRTYYFAEGTARANFEQYFCIENTNSTPAKITIQYWGRDWWASNDITVAPNSRATVNPREGFGTGDEN